MMKFAHAVLVLMGLFCAEAYAADTTEKIEWPNGAKAAIALTYDDALASHLDIALPQLNRHGLQGTFFLTIERDVFYERAEEWRDAAAEGHELANHTINHPCRGSLPNRDWVAPEADLDAYTVARLVRELRTVNGVLHMLDGEETRTYAYTCGETTAGDESYIDAIKPLFIAARGVQGENFVSKDGKVDGYRVATYGPPEVSGADLIAYAEKVRDGGELGTFLFHGVGGDYLTVSGEAHDELLAWLAEHRDEIWVDTFRNIMAYVNEQQAD